MDKNSQEIRLPAGDSLTKPAGSARNIFKLASIRKDIVPGAESDVPELDAFTRAAGDKPVAAAVMPRLRAPAAAAPQLLKRDPVKQPAVEVLPGKPARIVGGGPRYHPAVRRASILSKAVPAAVAPKPRMGIMRQGVGDDVFIQLGRYGDLMNLLPALQPGSGEKKTVVVAREFADLLDGVSYVKAKVFEGSHDQVAKARAQNPGAKVAQIWGDNMAPPRGENFQRDSWARIGRGHRWEQMALTFDRRDAAREYALANRVLGLEVAKELPHKPFVLVNTSSHSSPFQKGEKLLAELRADLSDHFDVVDISNVKAERIYDLLGLYDRANMLVTVDSAPLHLATASSIPVCALVNDRRWDASLRRTNYVVYRPYRDVNVSEIVAACRKTLEPSTVSKIAHVYAEYDMKPDDRRRADLAKRSWEREYAADGIFVGRGIGYKTDPEMRTADKTLGDARAVPYVRDMIEKGLGLVEGDDDIVLVTNSDVGFSVGFANDLRKQCAVFGACFGYRSDFGRLGDEAASFGKVETMAGHWSGGLDVMAFTVGWLKAHGDKLPDCVLGSRDWDIVYRDIIKYLRGGELVASHWHETHHSDWIQAGDSTPANAHNTAILRAWRAGHDTTRPFSL